MIKHDGESGLEHTLFRQYPAALGRWLSPDPLAGSIGNPQSLNRYAYVQNNPTNAVDPLGLFLSFNDGCFFPWFATPCSTEGGSSGVSFTFGLHFPGGGGRDDDPITPTPTPTPTSGQPAIHFPNETNGIPDGFGFQQLSVCQSLGLCPLGPACDFGACGVGNGFVVPVVAIPAFCVAQPEVCAGIALGTALLLQRAIQLLPLSTLTFARAHDLSKVDDIARRFCVDRRELGRLIHEEKGPRQRGKGSDLTTEEIKALARLLPKIPGCVPTEH